MKWNKYYTYIAIFSIIAVSLVGLMIFLINGNIKLTSFKMPGREGKDLILDETYNKKCNSINIESDCGNIYINASDKKEIRVVIHGDEKKHKISCEFKNNKLNIVQEQKKKISFFSFDNIMNRIEVYVPKDYSNKLEINDSYGNIEVDSFANANMDISESCGRVVVKEGKEVIISNDYGDIELNKAKIAEIEDSCGNIKIGQINDIDAKNDYGDIIIKKILNSLNLSDSCGNIKIENLNLNKNSEISDDTGDISIGSTNKIYIDAKTDLGNVKINNNYRKSNVELKIRNSCGDIKVVN